MKSKKLAQLVKISALKRDIELGHMAALTAARIALQAERDKLRTETIAAAQAGQASIPEASHADNFVILAQRKDAMIALDQARLASDIATQKAIAALAVGRANVIERLARK